MEHLYKDIERRVRDPLGKTHTTHRKCTITPLKTFLVENHEHCGHHSETFLKSLKRFVTQNPTLDRIFEG